MLGLNRPSKFPHGDRTAYRHRNTNTDLLDAIGGEHLQLVRRLLTSGASPGATCRQNGVTCCHVAAWLGKVDFLEELLDRGDDAYSRADKEGCTPAIYAAYAGHTAVLRLLQFRGVGMNDPVDRNKVGQVREDQSDSLSHDHDSLDDLLDDGVTEGSTPLHQACRRVHEDTVQFLVSCMAPEDVNRRDLQGQTALDVLGTRPASEDKLSDRMVQIINQLLDKGASFPECQLPGQRIPVTTLHTCVGRGDVDLVQLLLERGASLEMLDEGGDTPVHLAVKRMLPDPLSAMLNWDSKAVEVRDSLGSSALHLAVSRQWCRGVSLLLAAGADVLATAEDDRTVLHLAAESGNTCMLEDLLSIPECSQIIDSPDSRRNTPLSLAVGKDRVSCVDLLRRRGADLSRKMYMKEDEAFSLLHIAALENAPKVIEYFLTEKDLPREVRDLEDRGGRKRLTPLHLAAKKGHLETVEFILKENRDMLKIKDGRGWKPLHVAAMNGHREVVRAMLKNGADLSDMIRAEAMDGSRSSIQTTALDIIAYCIPQPVEFLKDIFDSYITMNANIDDPNCEIEIMCDLLVPNFGRDKPQMKVLEAMVCCKSEELQNDLLLHPIVETFLYLKWQKLKIFFYFLMTLYVLLTLDFTALAVLENVVKIKNDVTEAIAECLIWVLFATYLVIIFVEILTTGSLQTRKYDFEVWNKRALFMGVALTALDPFGWHRYLSAITILFCWTELLFLFARLPSGGYYVLMFTKVTTKVFKVLATFVILLLGFVFALIILFDSKGAFSTNWYGVEAFMKVFIMMTELDYGGSFDDGDSSAFAFFGRIVFLIFDSVVVIVLTNLMVGLAVSDVSQLEAQGRAQQLAKQIASLKPLEVCLYSKCLVKVLPPRLRAALKERRCSSTWIISGRNNLPTSIFPQLPESVRKSILHIALRNQVGTSGRQSEDCVTDGPLLQANESVVLKCRKDSSSSSSS